MASSRTSSRCRLRNEMKTHKIGPCSILLKTRWVLASQPNLAVFHERFLQSTRPCAVQQKSTCEVEATSVPSSVQNSPIVKPRPFAEVGESIVWHSHCLSSQKGRWKWTECESETTCENVRDGRARARVRARARAYVFVCVDVYVFAFAIVCVCVFVRV
eukprot:2263614-Pleurochrysis_carterae.AAC.7